MDIMQLLKNTELIKNVDDETFKQLCDNLERVEFSKDEMIIREGELGDAFYIIETGSVRVFTVGNDNEEIVLARLEPGNYFGEQALLDEAPKGRNASVKAISDVVLQKLSRAAFRNILNLDTQLLRNLQKLGKKRLLEKFSKQLSALATIEGSLIDLLETDTHEFAASQVIFKQGDFADYVYVILEGQVVIDFNGQNSPKPTQAILNAGHIFGELGVLEEKPRTGTATSVGNSKILVISANKFRDMYEKNSEIRKMVSALNNIYKIHNRGIVTQYYGKFLNMDAINSLFNLENGEVVLASRVINANIFSIIKANIKNPRKLLYEEEGQDIRREALIADGKLVGITNFGRWDDLGTVSAMVLTNADITSSKEEIFLKTGMFTEPVKVKKQQVEDNSQIICECMSVSRGVIKQAIESGATHVEQVSEKTSAGTVCGSCRQKIADILGRAVWFPASLKLVKEHNKQTRSYELKPNNCHFKLPKPGQYVLIQVEINRNWIERAYTLTSLPQDLSYEITLKREPLGLFSMWLFSQTADVPIVRVSPPMGQFLFDNNSSMPAVCFAGGIGITPIYSLVRYMVVTHSQRRVHIEYCARKDADFIFKSQLEEITKKYTNITINFRTSETVGRITADEIGAIISQFAQPEIYICGKEGFEKTVREAAKLYNIEEKHIHVEQFINAGGPIRG